MTGYIKDDVELINIELGGDLVTGRLCLTLDEAKSAYNLLEECFDEFSKRGR